MFEGKFPSLERQEVQTQVCPQFIMLPFYPPPGRSRTHRHPPGRTLRLWSKGQVIGVDH